MGIFNNKSASERLYKADKAVSQFTKGKKSLTEKEHRELSKLLSKRAKAMSDVFGVKISSISRKEAKRFRDKLDKR